MQPFQRCFNPMVCTRVQLWLETCHRTSGVILPACFERLPRSAMLTRRNADRKNVRFVFCPRNGVGGKMSAHCRSPLLGIFLENGGESGTCVESYGGRDRSTQMDELSGRGASACGPGLGGQPQHGIRSVGWAVSNLLLQPRCSLWEGLDGLLGTRPRPPQVRVTVIGLIPHLTAWFQRNPTPGPGEDRSGSRQSRNPKYLQAQRPTGKGVATRTRRDDYRPRRTRHTNPQSLLHDLSFLLYRDPSPPSSHCHPLGTSF